METQTPQSEYHAKHNLKKPSHQRVWKHGLSGHPIHCLWRSMVNRCHGKSNSSYPRYGARGITVCELWRRDFYEFFKWATQNGYVKGLFIDRIDGAKGYCPDNCRFVTLLESCHNTKTFRRTKELANKVKNLASQKLSISEISRRSGVSRATVRRAIAQ